MLFINTRPSSRAMPLTAVVQTAAIEVLELPLLTMRALTIKQPQQQQLYQLAKIDTPKPSVIIVISPAAAKFACQFLQTHNIQLDPNITVVAVGKATASCLAEYDISAVLPKIANNESMLELACLTSLTADPVRTDDNTAQVMIWRGQGGRRLLIDALRVRGISVAVFEWYQRLLPATSKNKLTTWLSVHKHQPKPTTHNTIILISSAEAFANWQQLLEQTTCQTTKHPLMGDCIYLTLGARLTALLTQHNLYCRQVDDLVPATILRQLILLAKET